MLRTLIFALALTAPSLAAADQFPEAATGAVVRSHDGSELGRVASVERDAAGNIVAVEIPGLEPGDAPYADSDLVAEERPYQGVSQRTETDQRARLQEVRATGRTIATR